MFKKLLDSVKEGFGHAAGSMLFDQAVKKVKDELRELSDDGAARGPKPRAPSEPTEEELRAEEERARKEAAAEAKRAEKERKKAEEERRKAEEERRRAAKKEAAEIDAELAALKKKLGKK